MIFRGESSTAQMRRTPEELAACLVGELTFPQGVFLMTGTWVVRAGFALSTVDARRGIDSARRSGEAYVALRGKRCGSGEVVGIGIVLNVSRDGQCQATCSPGPSEAISSM